MFFAAALMLSAANAYKDIYHASNKHEHPLVDNKPTSPVRRFNLETFTQQSNLTPVQDSDSAKWMTVMQKTRAPPKKI